MRALVLACLVVLAGCIIDNDRVRVESFTADTPTTFTFDAWTNTVMTANDDGRRRVGGETLDANPVVVDNAAGEHDEAGEDERAHLVGFLDSPGLSSIFLY